VLDEIKGEIRIKMGSAQKEIRVLGSLYFGIIVVISNWY
jgi:hypothetical protein